MVLATTEGLFQQSPPRIRHGTFVVAMASFIVACISLLGTKSISIGSILTMLVANPLSACRGSLAVPARTLGYGGQFLVPGASSWLIRSLSYFHTQNSHRSGGS